MNVFFWPIITRKLTKKQYSIEKIRKETLTYNLLLMHAHMHYVHIQTHIHITQHTKLSIQLKGSISAYMLKLNILE